MIAVKRIRISRTVKSETLHLPQLKKLVGKRVEITIIEKLQRAPSKNGKDPYQALFELAGQGLVDPEAVKKLRKASMK